jgi:type IV pilus assembly protein PilC
MSEFVLKYADSRGEIHQQVAEAASEQELRNRYSDQGYLIYSVRPRRGILPATTDGFQRRKKLNVEKFLIFNQQFVTLVRAGLPILKALDLLAERLTDPKLGVHIRNVRDEVKNGALLSEAFRREGFFPPIYVTSVLAGEKSGSLAEVIDRFIAYQKMALTVRKKLLVSLMYPSVLLVLVCCLVVFLVTFVVPNFAQLYSTMSANLPPLTQFLISVGTAAKKYILFFAAALAGVVVLLRMWSRREAAQQTLDSLKLHAPVLGRIWIMYQVGQFARVLSTLLVGGIPLVQALETASESMGSGLLKKSLEKTRRMVREGQPLSVAVGATGVFPGLAIDMIEVGESTGALPAMLTSVAEFYEEDVSIRMTAVLAMIEPAIMILMGFFVAFVLVALYLPIFSLADSLRG